MVFEDGSEQARKALDKFFGQKDELGCPDLKIQTVEEFKDAAKNKFEPLTLEEKETLVDQAVLLIDQFYAHLPFKRARHAIDPVQSLRLLRGQLDRLNDLSFHGKMIRIFMRLRDAHTYYGLPDPYRGAFAFLPFRMECYGEPGQRHFLVTDVMKGFEHEWFREGAEITLWQGTSIESAVELLADNEAGGNPAARFVRGMRRLTRRSFAFTVPPDERYTVIEYLPKAAGEQRSIILPWYVAAPNFPDKQFKSHGSSMNESMAGLKQFGEMLFGQDTIRKKMKMQQLYPIAVTTPVGLDGIPGSKESVELNQESMYPHVFEFHYTDGPYKPGTVNPGDLHDATNPDKKFGYIKIKTFELDSTETASDRFVEEFKRILKLMQQRAPDGLILDVRSNPGGAIDAGERILQMMTPVDIAPAKFHFIISRQTQQIASLIEKSKDKVSADQTREWSDWVQDLLASVTSGDFVTAGNPLTTSEQANDEEQYYQGPVTLVIDASSYSATDIFAAGFQDHNIGPVIGVDQNTGGGGANQWKYEELRTILAKISPTLFHMPELPRNAQMGLAIRRSSRVGKKTGRFLEDEGVVCDLKHTVTKKDILFHNQDLILLACGQLGKEPARSLEILEATLVQDDQAKTTEVPYDGVLICVKTRNVNRIECFLDAKLQCSFAVDDGIHNFWVPTLGLVTLPPHKLWVNSYAKVTANYKDDFKLVAKAISNIGGTSASAKAPSPMNQASTA